MKHNPQSDPPYFEIAPGVQVAHGATRRDDIRLLVDDVETWRHGVVDKPDREARWFATMLQAVYDKGRQDERLRGAKVWPRHRTKEEVAAAFEGSTRSGAAAILACSESSAYNLLKRYGLEGPRPARAQMSKLRAAEIRDAMESSATYREAGERLGGVSRQRAKQLALRLDIHPQAEKSRTAAIAPEILGDLAEWLDVLSATDVANLLRLSGASRNRATSRLLAAPRPLRERALKRSVLALRRDGWTQSVIAETVGTVQGNVSRIIVQARRVTPWPRRSPEPAASRPPRPAPPGCG